MRLLSCSSFVEPSWQAQFEPPARPFRGLEGGFPSYDDPRTWNRGQRSRAAGGHQVRRRWRGAPGSIPIRRPPSPGIVRRRETSATSGEERKRRRAGLTRNAHGSPAGAT